MNIQTSKLNQLIGKFDPKNNRDVLSDPEYKKIYYELADYYQSKELVDAKKSLKIIRKDIHNYHKNKITNADSAPPFLKKQKIFFL